MHFDARGSGGIGAIAVRSCMRDVAARHTLVRARTVPLGFRRRGLAGPGLPGGVARFVGRVEKCLCVARKFNSGLYNGIESPERSQRTTRHPGAPLPPGNCQFRNSGIPTIRRTFVVRHRGSAPAPASGIVDGAILQLRHCGNCALRRRGAHAAPGPWRVRSGVEFGGAPGRVGCRRTAAPGCPCPGVDRAGGPAVSVTARRRVDRQSDAA